MVSLQQVDNIPTHDKISEHSSDCTTQKSFSLVRQINSQGITTMHWTAKPHTTKSSQTLSRREGKSTYSKSFENGCTNLQSYTARWCTSWRRKTVRIVVKSRRQRTKCSIIEERIYRADIRHKLCKPILNVRKKNTINVDRFAEGIQKDWNWIGRRRRTDARG